MNGGADLERWLDAKLQLAYQQGFRDGVDCTGEVMRSEVDAFTSQLREEFRAEVDSIRSELDREVTSLRSA